MNNKDLERLEDIEQNDLLNVIEESLEYSTKKPYIKIENIMSDLVFLLELAKKEREI